MKCIRWKIIFRSGATEEVDVVEPENFNLQAAIDGWADMIRKASLKQVAGTVQLDDAHDGTTIVFGMDTIAAVRFLGYQVW